MVNQSENGIRTNGIHPQSLKSQNRCEKERCNRLKLGDGKVFGIGPGYAIECAMNGCAARQLRDGADFGLATNGGSLID